MSSLRIADIITQAVAIETNGELFYSEQALKFADKEDIRSLFERLALEEKGHKAYFSSLLHSVAESGVPDDNMAFMESFVKRMIFDSDRFRSEMRLIATVHEALDFAIRRELDSVLYYYELKRIVDATHHDTVEKIAQEERRHVTILTEIKEKYNKKEGV